ncbi:hypothetical protein [Streptomyces sp. VRA16 Mangrove soil]|uniref:hypothetical protein n=1 Tax=Streptomyces sp. VRA16 Mangrove soil TaxID=2817434 RepID=UPI001A9D19E2|nr:hypothetical protein [Streptomyces sp. VRA16 Mangrove soil]MBO1332518.1 hypothetical protein [Streptomyces sp. VRA16 Mangrove soil]
MNTAEQLATIDGLWSRPFPADHGRSAAGWGGPGYVVAELTRRHGAREEAEDQAEADRDGLTALLDGRWGEPYRFSLWSVHTRALEHGEEIPEPWDWLSACAQDLHLWSVGERWVALAVAHQGDDSPYQLLAVVTDVAPP